MRGVYQTIGQNSKIISNGGKKKNSWTVFGRKKEIVIRPWHDRYIIYCTCIYRVPHWERYFLAYNTYYTFIDQFEIPTRFTMCNTISIEMTNALLESRRNTDVHSTTLLIIIITIVMYHFNTRCKIMRITVERPFSSNAIWLNIIRGQFISLSIIISRVSII